MLVAICSRKVAMNAGQPAGGWLVHAPARECRRATQNGTGGLLVSDYSGADETWRDSRPRLSGGARLLLTREESAYNSCRAVLDRTAVGGCPYVADIECA